MNHALDSRQELISSQHYIVLTFATTTQALKAEQTLKSGQAVFVPIPTPREVSASCGISMKIPPHVLSDYKEMIESSGISINGIYDILGTGKNASLTRLDC